MANKPQRNLDVEVIYWEFTKEMPTNHPMKVSSIIECTLLLKGSTKAIMNGQKFVLKQGDDVVIAPGAPNNNVVEILKDCAGITIKSPSDPSAKTIIHSA